jgi:thioredoxin 1
MPVSITKENFEQEIVKSKLPVVVDVYATWCGPCQYMTPVIAELEKELGSKYKFVKINVDEARDLSIQYGVTSVPTFLFIKDNQIKGKVTGAMSKQDLLKKIQESLG